MRVGPTLDRLLQEYPESLRIVYKMHPLANHAFAQKAAQAALAAGKQGKFLEMHEALLERARTFSTLGAAKATELGLPAGQHASAQVQDAIFTDLAVQLGLDMARFRSDYSSESIRKQIEADKGEVVAVGATGTPASFINGRYLRGAQPYTAFKALVDEMLQAGAGGAGPGANP